MEQLDGDVDAIVDLMESELGSSSKRQDRSALAKFNSFLHRHVAKNLTLDTLQPKDLSKELFGKLLTFLFNDPDIRWQTSMNYVSSIKRQLEDATGTDLFRSEPDWYKRCRRHLHNQYLMQAISSGQRLKEQAPPMTMDDLRAISTILFLKNDIKSLQDRSLLNKQWLAIGRSSDVGTIHFSDLHWHDSYFLIDVTRIKVRQQQAISIFCSPVCWSVDPFHALACQLLVDPYNASPRVFSQITASNTDAHFAAYINRVLKSVYEYDHDDAITRNLQSHSTRRGGAAYASSNSSVNLADLAHRGLWSMDGFSTLLEYISPTSSSDQNVAKVLGGWTNTKQAGHPPSLRCFEMASHHTCVRVNEFAKSLRVLHFAKITPKGFADCLTATLLMYYRDTMSIAPHHLIHQELQRVHQTLPSSLETCQDELLAWGSAIRKQFVTDNILALPVERVRECLTPEEQAQQFLGLHTFGDTLERILTGFQQLATANMELKSMMHLMLDRIEQQNNQQREHDTFYTSMRVVGPLPSTNEPARLALRPAIVTTSWPDNLKSLKGKRLSDFLVQYISENLGALPRVTGNRGQKDCLRAVEIIAHVADLKSIPSPPPVTRETERKLWLSAMQRMAARCEQALVDCLASAADTSQTKRKRKRSGTLTGIVKGWSELTEHQRAAVRSFSRIRFDTTPP